MDKWCGKCYYWRPSVEDRDGRGECHRYPPNEKGQWSRTWSALDWCGEFKDKPND